MPESGCNGAVISFPLHRSQLTPLCRAIQLGTDQSGKLLIPVFNVLVSRAGLTLSLRDRDGLVPLTIVLMEWKKAWDLMGYGSAEFNGAEAINAYRSVIERIESGMPKRRGERGLHIQERGKRDNWASEVLSRLDDMSLLQAINSSLETIPEEDLPAAYRAAVISIRQADNKMARAERVRSLRRDATTGIRSVASCWSRRCIREHHCRRWRVTCSDLP